MLARQGGRHVAQNSITPAAGECGCVAEKLEVIGKRVHVDASG